MSLTPPNYKLRFIDEKIKKYINIFGAVCIEGPKWCGKTWTALNHANSVFYVGDPNLSFQNRILASIDPKAILIGQRPRLIDEWQEVGSIWDAVRFEVDKTIERGQFILTGSSTPQAKGILHSGTGRIHKIKMRTMALSESGDSSQEVSLMQLFSNDIIAQQTKPTSLDNLIELVVRGGWPMSIGLPKSEYIEIPRSYLNSIISDDLDKLDGIKRNKMKIRALIKSLARNVSTVVSYKTLKEDIKEFDNEIINEQLIPEYIEVLERMFIIEEQRSFNPNYRSKDRVAKSPKRHFVDPSLAVAALGLTHEMLLNDLKLFGFLFESIVIRDLKTYSDLYDANVYHYKHFDTNNELDAVIELKDGRWIAIEIKLGANQIDNAAKSLLAVKNFLSYDEKASKPCALVIICGMSDAAYRREDGVIVVPFTALKP